MFEFTSQFTESTSGNFEEIKKAMQELQDTEVYVGIPESENVRKSGNIGNAALLAIHSVGSPIKSIPPRPVLDLAIEDSKDRIGEILQNASKQAMDGNANGMREELQKAGATGVLVTQAYFPKLQPNAESTKKIKARKGSDKAVPLINTDELRKSITYVIRKKGE